MFIINIILVKINLKVKVIIEMLIFNEEEIIIIMENEM